MESNALGGGMTPLHIEVALHYYKSRDTEVVAYTGRDIDATARFHREFLDAGLLEIAGDNKHWKATDKLRLYLEALCNVPLPAEQPVMSADENSPYAAILQEKNIGDTTVKTRNAKIATVMDKYLAVTSRAKM